MNYNFNQLKKALSTLYPNATENELTDMTDNLIQFFITVVNSSPTPTDESLHAANDNKLIK